jgi:hypothetical protein
MSFFFQSKDSCLHDPLPFETRKIRNTRLQEWPILAPKSASTSTATQLTCPRLPRQWVTARLSHPAATRPSPYPLRFLCTARQRERRANGNCQNIAPNRTGPLATKSSLLKPFPEARSESVRRVPPLYIRGYRPVRRSFEG